MVYILSMMKIFLAEIYRMSYIEVLGSILFFVLLWSIFMFRIREYKNCTRVLNCVITCIFLCVLIMVTIVNREVDYNTIINQKIYFIKEQRDYLRPIIMNILLFSPYGVFFPYGIWGRMKKRIWMTIISALIISLSIEFVQMFYGRGYFEVIDIVTNVLGATIGSISYFLYCKLKFQYINNVQR